MRKRIQKEEFSPERRQQTRDRREDVQRELRGESPAKREQSGFDKKPYESRDSRPPRKEFNGEKREFKPRTEGGYEKREFNRDSRPPRREFNGEKREFKPRAEGGYEKREFNKD